MRPVRETVRQFFEVFEKEAMDPSALATCYGETFLFAGPQGTRVIQKAAFLQMIPQRTKFFQTAGLVSSMVQVLEETRLNEHYLLVDTQWQLRFEPPARKPLVEAMRATYLLHEQADGLRVVLQLDHEDLMQRVKAMGLLPAVE